ncbi:MAG: hypothetical protein LBS67_07140, partial [Clostridiales Family XIII bacterium]|nr:hypothetical protein [Clostridiales Family XIII bacterium]
MKSTEYRKAGKGRPALSVFACGLAAFIVTMGFVLFSCKTSFDHIPRQLYGIVYDTRKVAGLVVRDKAGEVYESETSFIFERKYGGEAVSGGRMDFTFFLDVAEGFDESDVSFDDPNVACDIGPARGRTISNGLNVDRLNIDRLNVNAGAIADGWRRLTVHCEDFDTSKALTVKLRYSAEALLLRDAAAGDYRWDVDEYT